MKVTWYGHACFKVESENSSAVFDPYEPGYVPGLSMPGLCADAVFCSHGHRDHNYSEAVTLSGRPCGFTVTQLESFHDEAKGRKRGENTITQLDFNGWRAVHLGDLGHELSPAQIKTLYEPDLLLIPVGGYYTIDAKTAFKVVQSLKPKNIIPMHYRGRGFGYEVISEVGEFTKLFDNVCCADTNSIELSTDETRGVIVLRCPVK